MKYIISHLKVAYEISTETVKKKYSDERRFLNIPLEAFERDGTK